MNNLSQPSLFCAIFFKAGAIALDVTVVVREWDVPGFELSYVQSKGGQPRVLAPVAYRAVAIDLQRWTIVPSVGLRVMSSLSSSRMAWIWFGMTMEASRVLKQQK